MDIIVWGAIAGGVALLLLALAYFAPARTTIVIDTAASTARADMRVLWGVGPLFLVRALSRDAAGSPLGVFNDPVRIGYALMTPGIAEAAYAAVRSLFQHNPRVARLELGVNLGDPAQNRVVQTAAQAAFAAAPGAMRDIVAISKCEAPGAEFRGQFELDASPASLSGIWTRFRDSRPVREFRRRLKRKPKPEKRPVREVRTS
jgi:hypothetical protein